MKKEQRRIAIAEACGWTDCEYIKSLGLCKGKHKEVRVQYDTGHSALPDYLNDLNAMQQAKLSLSPEELGTFTCILIQMGVDRNFNFVVATAEQQAEAFLRTIDKWTTEP